MIRVVLVDQYVIFRAGLKLLLETDGDISVVADGGSLEESLEMISGESPDLILMELCSDSRSVIELMDDIAAASPESRILLLANDQNGDAHGEAILAGAHGVISKDQSAEILRMAVKKVCEGEAWIDRTLTSKLLSGIRKHEIDAIDEQKKIDRLTPKELEITKLIAIGWSIKRLEIASIFPRKLYEIISL